MKKKIKKLALSKDTVKHLEADLGKVAGGEDTVGNSCPICFASRVYACFSPPTGG